MIVFLYDRIWRKIAEGFSHRNVKDRRKHLLRLQWDRRLATNPVLINSL